MSAPRQIPGFHYDPVKRKYFKTLPNHRATEAESTHSTAAVRARDSKDRKCYKALADKNRVQKHLIRRSPIWANDPNLLYTRLGIYRSCYGGFAKIFAHSLCPSTLSRYPEATFTGFSLCHDGSLWVSENRNAEARQSFYCMHSHETAPAWHSPQQIGSRSALPTILAVNDAGFICHATYGRSNIICRNSATDYVKEFVLNQKSVWDAAISVDQNTFAFATTHGLWKLDINSSGICRSSSTIDEFMTCNFMDANVIMAGARSGLISLVDSRVQSSVARLRHSCAVSGVCVAKNKNLIIVNGLSHASVFDLRYVKECKPVHKPKKRQKRGKTSPGQADEPVKYEVSQHVVDFAVPKGRPYNTDIYWTGKTLAYLPDTNLAIVSSGGLSKEVGPERSVIDVEEYRISFYDVSTGRRVESPLTRTKYNTPIVGLAAGRVGDRPESVLVLTKDTIEEWSPQAGGEQKMVENTLDNFPPNADRDVVKLWEDGNQRR